MAFKFLFFANIIPNKVNWRENSERQFGNEWHKHAGTLEFAPLIGIQNVILPVCSKPTLSKSSIIEVQLTGATDDQEFLLGDKTKTTVTLIQDVPFPKVSFSAPEVNFKQSGGLIKIPLQRTTNLREELSANWMVKSDHPAYKNLSGAVHFADGQSDGAIEIKLPDFPQVEEFSKFSISLDRENDACQIGSHPDLSCIIENDVEPSAVEGRGHNKIIFTAKLNVDNLT